MEQIESTSIVGRTEEVKSTERSGTVILGTINTATFSSLFLAITFLKFNHSAKWKNAAALHNEKKLQGCSPPRRGTKKGFRKRKHSSICFANDLKQAWFGLYCSKFFAHSYVLRSWEELVMQWGTNLKFFLTKSHKIIKLLWRILGIQSFRSTNTQRNVRYDQRTRDQCAASSWQRLAGERW